MKRFPPHINPKDYLQTLDDVYKERVRFLIEAESDISLEDMEKAVELECKIAEGLALALSEVQWLNQCLDKYGLG